jgi:hypothetical protein
MTVHSFLFNGIEEEFANAATSDSAAIVSFSASAHLSTVWLNAKQAM